MLTFLLVRGAGGVLGLAGALVFGTTVRRVAVVAAVGIVALGALFLSAYLSAPTDPQGDTCHDCSLWHGRYLDALAFLVPLLNGAGWVVGACTGGVLRRIWTTTSSEAST